MRTEPHHSLLNNACSRLSIGVAQRYALGSMELKHLESLAVRLGRESESPIRSLQEMQKLLPGEQLKRMLVESDFARLRAHLDAQSGFINEVARFQVRLAPAIQSAIDAQRIVENLCGPAMHLLKLTQQVHGVIETVAQQVLANSIAYQQLVANEWTAALRSSFEPLLRQDLYQNLSESLYFLDLPEDAPGQNEPALIEVIGSITPELIHFFAQRPDQLKTIDRRKFEELVAELFSGFGYDVELTARTKDGGKDIVAMKSRPFQQRFLIECKRPDPGNPVTVAQVRQLLGVKTHEKASKAILATTTHFSSAAQLFLCEHKWELEGKDFDGLLEWIEDYLRLVRR
jgi:hypothetical protein